MASNAQGQYEPIEPKHFKEDVFNSLLLQEINALRANHGKRALRQSKALHSLAKKASNIQEQSGRKPNALLKLREELEENYYDSYDPVSVVFQTMQVNPTYTTSMTYDLAVKETIRRWFGNSTDRQILLSNNFYLFSSETEMVPKSGILLTSAVFSSENLKDPLGIKNHKKAYRLKNGFSSTNSACAACRAWFDTLPSEVHLEVIRDKDSLVFHCSDVQYLANLLVDEEDGIATDIVSIDQFRCNGGNFLDPHWAYDGLLLEPIFKERLLNPNYFRNGEVFVPIGAIPIALREDKLEFNLILIKQNTVCLYNQFVPILSYRWQLLNTGFATNMRATKNGGEREEEGLLPFRKDLKYEFKFDKNEDNLDPEGLAALFEALQLEHYTIDSVSILAYASVEGTKEENVALQRKRALALVKVLEMKIGDTIPYHIESHENWGEFYRDLDTSSYQWMLKKPQGEIKDLLNKEGYFKKLEHILANHRKAICEVYLKNESVVFPDTLQELLALFDDLLGKEQLDKLLQLQDYMIQQIRNEQLPAEVISGTKIPMQAAYGSILNNRLGYLINDQKMELEEAINRFQKIYSLDTSNLAALFNLTTLQVMHWAEKLREPSSKRIVERALLEERIHRLLTSDLPKDKIEALQINFRIVLSEYQMKEKAYEEKRETVRQLINSFNLKELSPSNIVVLAQYQNSYFMFQDAYELLKPYVMDINGDLDVLFYFLNLSLTNNDWREKSHFKSAFYIASVKDKKRFCEIFSQRNSTTKRGLSFQLMRYGYLKQLYCEVCQK